MSILRRFGLMTVSEHNRRMAAQTEYYKDTMAQQASDLNQLRPAYEAQRKEVNTLALWLRENKKSEIAQGLHMGKSLSQVLIQYLAAANNKEN